MGGIDKSDMLVHLYKTPIKSKRWYLRMFAYTIDVSLTNAWVMYKRDCKALAVKDSLSLKHFRIQVFRGASCQKPQSKCSQKHSESPALNTTADVPAPVRGHRNHIPDNSVRFDLTLFHAPVYSNRQTCKYCSRKGHILRSNVVCQVCKVHLCLNADRNCFIMYHQQVA
ncbi:uncharacterized protein LOC143021875 [Oratosquilla oratoria]|uniref:uncharacterized protein LOC143021875 n=1 Tax=Oratosquilla oratoria TaxID=337810 RepID=UPI003F75E433